MQKRKGMQLLGMLCLMLCMATSALGASCEEALKTVFKNEGGFQNAKGDTGNFIKGVNCGGTKYGVTCRDANWFLKKKGITIKQLTVAQAAEYYNTTTCKELKFTEFEGQKVPTKLFDLAVNMGSGTAIIIFNKTLNRLNGIDILPETTTLSEEAIQIYNYYTQDDTQRSLFYLALILQALDRYSDIVEKNPKQAQWLLGWIIRLNPYSD